ncbi:MAG TPA: radical SAM protein, partial [Anaerolineae bacterium]|nr:radical SAM protein [Anaerolineae bacterium]
TKNWGGKLTVALTYPNTYYIGMSSLAMQLIYRRFNQNPTVVCERVFWEKGAQRTNSRPISLESQRPVDEFDVWAFTISYEMDYFHVVEMLKQAHVPPLAKDRVDGGWPLLLAGGPALTMNPEPLAPFFDAIVIGEGEEVMDILVDILRDGVYGNRRALLEALDQVPGVYVPLLVPKYPSVALKSSKQQPTSPPRRIQRLWVRDLARYPAVSSVYTPDTEFGNMHLMEIARGCGRGCRFCLAGYVYRPAREQPLDLLLNWAKDALQEHRRLGLISAAVSDYSRIDELATELRAMGACISVSSMRTDPISVPLVEAIHASGTQTLTIAPEAGSERLRRVINKVQSEANLLAAVDLAERLRFPQLKLYFMIGHPTETDDDIQALIDLTLEARKRFRRRIAINATPFVPKAHTPFQWIAMAPVELLEARQERIRRALGRHKIAVRAESPQWAAVQGVLARGDRRLADVLLRMNRLSVRAFHEALADVGLEASDYLEERDPTVPQPWHIVESGVRDRFFQRELRLAQQERTGKGCPPGSVGCLACGVCDPAWAFRPTNMGQATTSQQTVTNTHAPIPEQRHSILHIREPEFFP